MKILPGSYEEKLFDRIAETFIEKGISELLELDQMEAEKIKSVMYVAYNIAADAIESREIVTARRMEAERFSTIVRLAGVE